MKFNSDVRAQVEIRGMKSGTGEKWKVGSTVGGILSGLT